MNFSVNWVPVQGLASCQKLKHDHSKAVHIRFHSIQAGHRKLWGAVSKWSQHLCRHLVQPAFGSHNHTTNFTLHAVIDVNLSLTENTQMFELLCSLLSCHCISYKSTLESNRPWQRWTQSTNNSFMSVWQFGINLALQLYLSARPSGG